MGTGRIIGLAIKCSRVQQNSNELPYRPIYSSATSASYCKAPPDRLHSSYCSFSEVESKKNLIYWFEKVLQTWEEALSGYN